MNLLLCSTPEVTGCELVVRADNAISGYIRDVMEIQSHGRQIPEALLWKLVALGANAGAQEALKGVTL